MKRLIILVGVLGVFVMTGCDSKKPEASSAGTFGDDLAFLKEHQEVIVLSDESDQAQVAIVGAYQGRVMTSTAAGADGLSFGWINRELIASGEIVPHINAFGGEDRFWMGPEGGQFAIFFEEGAEFNLDDWQTPPLIDSEPFDLVSSDSKNAKFTRTASVTNFSGTKFDLTIDRVVKLLDAQECSSALGVDIADSIKTVAYQTDNSITNKGDKAWTREGGLLSIWILGMYNPSDETTVVIPFEAGTESELGTIVNDEYFGKVPAERLIVTEDVLYFSGDGKYRSKIGLSPARAKPILGSYDAANKVLTLVQYTKPEGATDYVNSMWEMQDEPFAGDVVNSYNDGPPEPGKKPLGPFYELETSSPAAALAPGETLSHMHRTFHLQGDESELDKIARATLGVSLAKVKAAMAE